MSERTLAIIKPDAFAQNVVGQIITMAESRGLSIIGVKLLHLTQEQAENFYHVHRGKEFFHSLTQFMSEGAIIALVFQGKDRKGRAARLLLTNPKVEGDGKAGKNITLTLSYIEKPLDPDVFKIKDGEF